MVSRQRIWNLCSVAPLYWQGLVRSFGMAHALEHSRHFITVRAGVVRFGTVSCKIASMSFCWYVVIQFLPFHCIITRIHLVVLVWAAVDTYHLVRDCLAEPCARCVSSCVCAVWGVLCWCCSFYPHTDGQSFWMGQVMTHLWCLPDTSTCTFISCLCIKLKPKREEEPRPLPLLC